MPARNLARTYFFFFKEAKAGNIYKIPEFEIFPNYSEISLVISLIIRVFPPRQPTAVATYRNRTLLA